MTELWVREINMAEQQIAASYQNDKNFAQLDLKDVAINGPTFELKPNSNRVFRSIDLLDKWSV